MIKNEFQETENGSNRVSVFICFQTRGEIALLLLFSHFCNWKQNAIIWKTQKQSYNNNNNEMRTIFSFAWFYVVAIDQSASQPAGRMHLHIL